MRKLRNFKCLNGHITEKFVEDHVKKSNCDQCSEEAIKTLSAPRCFQNTVGKSPSV